MNKKNTKVIVMGSSVENKPVKSIEFVRSLSCTDSNSIDSVQDTDNLPSDYRYVELICCGYHEGYDLMFAYNNPDDRASGILYIGYFNDGVV